MFNIQCNVMELTSAAIFGCVEGSVGTRLDDIDLSQICRP